MQTTDLPFVVGLSPPHLSLRQLFIVCHFFAGRGEKMTHKALNIIGRRKYYVLLWLMSA
jgi:hypothetical protein